MSNMSNLHMDREIIAKEIDKYLNVIKHRLDSLEFRTDIIDKGLGDGNFKYSENPENIRKYVDKGLI